MGGGVNILKTKTFTQKGTTIAVATLPMTVYIHQVSWFEVELSSFFKEHADLYVFDFSGCNSVCSAALAVFMRIELDYGIDREKIAFTNLTHHLKRMLALVDLEQNITLNLKESDSFKPWIPILEPTEEGLESSI